ncbi:hypothetical protein METBISCDRAFT_26026 [Metschnikowia bicuspidata]|uniref:Uncharacterized protein n=1 Tax=Metschnikowia bicuspidata TaxID=27322 RepID=A0A4P9ZG72_9ASCO|nr:hypothetical protein METBISCDRAFT_26026 [Metschnikowia bicuspidata]
MASIGHSSANSTEMPSDYESPRGPRPAPLFPLHAASRPKTHRSSSINSVTSTSTHQRSLSLVSLESPRNSIVSIDDVFVRPPRSDSSCSLVSLGAGSPKDAPRDPLVARPSKTRARSSCVAVLDEDISESEYLPLRAQAWRRKSCDKVPRPMQLFSLKKDFTFPYDVDCKLRPAKPSPTPSQAPRASEDSHPSPLSLSAEGARPPTHIVLDDDLPCSTVASKKVRSSSVTHSMLLKKKFLLSKEIRLELLAGSPAASAPVLSVSDTRLPLPSLKLPTSTRDSIHSYFPGANDSVPPAPMAALHGLLGEHMPTSRPLSPSACPFEPPCTDLRKQNMLLSKLNRKWNRAVFCADDAGDALFNSAVSSKKRARSKLASSTDSVSVS